MRKSIGLACLLALFVVSSAFAAGEARKPKSAQFDAATCGDILDIFAAADPKLNKDKTMLRRAQDRAFAYVAWTHGYLNGRDGIDARRYAFDQDGVNRLVAVMFKACKGNDPKPYLDVVKELR
jgi:hypothetical protein